jgi:hypothetical protein
MSLSLHQKMSLNNMSTERQQSINYFVGCILYNPRVVLRLLPIIEVLAPCIGNVVNVDVSSSANDSRQSVNCAATERHLSVN